MDRMELTPGATAATVRTLRWSMTAIRRLLLVSLVAIAFVVSHLAASAALAAPLAQDPTGGINAAIERATTALTTLGRPLAIFAVVLGFIAYLMEPILPEWARDNRGVIGKSILCAIAIGIAPDIIGFFLA